MGLAEGRRAPMVGGFTRVVLQAATSTASSPSPTAMQVRHARGRGWRRVSRKPKLRKFHFPWMTLLGRGLGHNPQDHLVTVWTYDLLEYLRNTSRGGVGGEWARGRGLGRVAAPRERKRAVPTSWWRWGGWMLVAVVHVASIPTLRAAAITAVSNPSPAAT